MRYASGQEVHLGDRVKLGADSGGLVVCSIDADEFTEEYPRDAWSFLQRGVLVDFPSYGLIHYEEVEPGLDFLERGDLRSIANGSMQGQP